ncbi:DJ-1/PfpI family protein, partial [Streptococcus pyogenes]
MAKVAVILADGFEEIEALTPVDVLRRADIECDMIGLTGECVTG